MRRDYGFEDNLTELRLFKQWNSPSDRFTPPFDGVCTLKFPVDDHPLLGRLVFEGKHALLLTTGVPVLDPDDVGVIPSIDRLDRERWPRRHDFSGKNYNWKGRRGENSGYDFGNIELFVVLYRDDVVLAVKEYVFHVVGKCRQLVALKSSKDWVPSRLSESSGSHPPGVTRQHSYSKHYSIRTSSDGMFCVCRRSYSTAYRME